MRHALKKRLCRSLGSWFLNEATRCSHQCAQLFFISDAMLRELDDDRRDTVGFLQRQHDVILPTIGFKDPLTFRQVI